MIFAQKNVFWCEKKSKNTKKIIFCIHHMFLKFWTHNFEIFELFFLFLISPTRGGSFERGWSGLERQASSSPTSVRVGGSEP